MPKAFLVKKSRCCRGTFSKATDNERRSLPSTSENFGVAGNPLAESFPTGQMRPGLNVTRESGKFERLLLENRQMPGCDSEASISEKTENQLEEEEEEKEDKTPSRISILTSGDVTACVSPIPSSIPEFSGSTEVVHSGTESTWNRCSFFPLSSTPKTSAVEASLQSTMTSPHSDASTSGKRLQFPALSFF